MDETRQPKSDAEPARPAPNAPVVDPTRVALVVAAVKAGFSHVHWWPELAPLTDKERTIVRQQVFAAARR